MTGRTHDLAAFTALSYVVLTNPLPHISLATALFAFSANMIGGLAPDIDQPTADLWHKLPGGSVYSRLFTPFLGGHRHISHSILGLVLFGFLSKTILGLASGVILVDMNVVWASFMIGYVSHLVMDTFTHDGVPWLFPIPICFGIPPFAFLRIKTAGLVEKSFVFPGLLIGNVYIFYSHYQQVLLFLHEYIR